MVILKTVLMVMVMVMVMIIVMVMIMVMIMAMVVVMAEFMIAKIMMIVSTINISYNFMLQILKVQTVFQIYKHHSNHANAMFYMYINTLLNHTILPFGGFFV